MGRGGGGVEPIKTICTLRMYQTSRIGPRWSRTVDFSVIFQIVQDVVVLYLYVCMYRLYVYTGYKLYLLFNDCKNIVAK